ncbi:MAG: hypothetical protein V2G42_06550 [bacterium JZ-2024 1]
MNRARILLPVVFVLAVSGSKVLERKSLGGLVPINLLLTLVVIALIVWVLRDEIPSPFRGPRRRVLIATVVLLGLSLGPFALLDEAIIRVTEEIAGRRIGMEWSIPPVYAPLAFVTTVLSATRQELLFTYLTQEILTRLTGRKWIA